MKFTIREIRPSEYPLLRDFLYEAIFVPKGTMPPPKSILDAPELQVYVENYGVREDDMGLVAVVEGQVVGAVWVRVMEDYGHLEDGTPSFALSLYKEYRGQGLGTALMKAMLSLLKERGYRRASLAVQKANYAVRLYQAVGFQSVSETESEYLMMITL